MPLCTSCGAELQPNSVFCSTCGTAVASEPAAPAPAPVAAATTTAIAVSDVRAWAMWSHLSAIGGLVFPFGNILAPLIIWLSKRDEISEVNVNGKEAMNFQITMSAASIVLWGASVFATICSAFLPRAASVFLTLFFDVAEILGWLAIVTVWIIFVTQASVAAYSGKLYVYPFSIRLIK